MRKLQVSTVAVIIVVLDVCLRSASADTMDVINYHFDESTGTVAHDSSGLAYNGALHGNPAWVTGHTGTGALTFDGSGNYVSIPENTTSSLSRFGIEFWVKTTENRTSTTYYQRPTLIGKSSSGSASGDFGITTNNGYIGFWSGLGADNSFLSTTKQINDNQWHFVKATTDGATARLYVDGALQGSFAASGQLDSTVFFIGACNNAGSAAYYHAGTIDEVKIYAIGDTGQTRGGWVKYPRDPLPTLACLTYGTIFDITVLKEPDTFKMWVSWRAQGCVGYVKSLDGITWTPPTCVLNTTGSSWQSGAVNRPSVIYHNGQYHLWYTGQANSTSSIGYATSPNGINWTRQNNNNPVLTATVAWESPSVMNPTVMWDSTANLYKMWYCGGQDYEPDAIAYATSTDGINWTKYAGNPIFTKVPANHWESVKVAGEQVIKNPWGPTGAQGYLMFYISYATVDSTAISMAWSVDGITNWVRYVNNPIIRHSLNDGFDASACYKPFAVLVGNKWMLYYNGRNGSPEQIALATHEGADLGFPPGTGSNVPTANFESHEELEKTFKVAGSTLILPKQFASRTNSVSIFDIKGRLVRKFIAKSNLIDLGKGIGTTGGVYIVRVTGK
jgi:predicted GH43/DUF377 family glycosyl hydrolase